MTVTVADHDEAVSSPRVWFLNAEEVAATRVKLEKVAARATRKGFTGRVDLEVTPAVRTQMSPGGLPVTEHGFEVTIKGEAPRYAGWRLVAAVDHLDGGAVVRYVPGAEVTVANDQIRAGECDHCHTQRVRHSTLLVAHEGTGQVVQVGRSCLKDFLGHDTRPVFLTVDEIADDLDHTRRPAPAAWDTASVLAYAWAAVQAFGWTPASATDRGATPTREIVRLALTGGRGAAEVARGLAPHLAEATKRAPEIRQALIAGLSGTAGYEANLTAVLRGDTVVAGHLGLAVSAIAAHQRLQAAQACRTAHETMAATAQHVGELGDKVTLCGTVTTAIRVDGYTYRSPDQVMLVVDCGTAVAKMTTSAAWAYHVKVGEPLTVTGTVKAHSQWRGINQTVLTRPKQLDTPPAGEPKLRLTTQPRRDAPVKATVYPPRTQSRGASPPR